MLHKKGIKIICILALTIILQVNSQCNANCFTCVSAGVCSACNAGFALTGADTCTNCGTTNQFSFGVAACADCTANCATGSCNRFNGVCMKCNVGFAYDIATRSCISCALTNQFSLGTLPCGFCTSHCATGSCNALTGICSAC